MDSEVYKNILIIKMTNPIMTLFHGSPYNLTELIPKKPTVRSSDKFQKQKGVFMTDIEKNAQIFALVREKGGKKKSFGVLDGKLYICKPYVLNEKAYVYIYTTKSYIFDVKDKNNRNQYVIKRKIIPKYKYIVKKEDIIDSIVEFDNKEEYKKELDRIFS